MIGRPVILQWAQNLVHPYPRYGLAIAIQFHTDGKSLGELTEDDIRLSLAYAIEEGLEHFRMETNDDPKVLPELRFKSISLDRLRSHTDLVSGKLAELGKYLYPSIITSDKQARGTFVDAEAILTTLRDKKINLGKSTELKRSIAPISGEINNGGKEKQNQKVTLFEAACAAVATLTFDKPAALMDGSNTGIFPDLKFADLCEFASSFHKFQAQGKNRMIGKPGKDGKYRRPPLCDGNYPDAPDESAFGTVGLLAAMGGWASRAEETTRKETLAVLDSLAEIPLYMVSYSRERGPSVSQNQFSHHVIELAKSGNLRGILSDFYREARPYATLDDSQLRHELPVFRFFYFAFSRFLQRFNTSSFHDFLSTRAEYPSSTDHLLGAYFMQAEHIPRDIVVAARALGQWINKTAYWVAEEETDKGASNRPQAVRKAKAKVLVEFESAVMSAEDPADMLHRVSTRAGRLLQGDAPNNATAFFDATATGDISFKTAQHLLIAYLRLRANKVPELISSLDGDSGNEDSKNTGSE